VGVVNESLEAVAFDPKSGPLVRHRRHCRKHSAENAIACAEHERAVFFANAMLTVTSTKAPVAAVSALRRWRSCCRQQADVSGRHAPALLGT